VTLDIGEVLTRAWQITWRHKVLWLFSALPVLLSFLIFPFVSLPIFFMDQDPFGNRSLLDEPLYILLLVGFSIFISLLSFLLYGISSSSVLLGVLRADEGSEQIRFRELLNDGKKYWWRVLGVMLLVGLGISVILMVVFGCMLLFSILTAGIGFICMQPLMLLMYPTMMVLYGFIEETQAAVVVDELGVMDAIRRGWELVRSNFWPIVLISLIVYLGIGFLSAIVMLPFMMPFFFVPIFMETQQVDFNSRTLMLIMGGFSLVLLPVMALVQGITITFLKSTYTLVYLRLTRPAGAPQPVLQEAPA
jgi:hypothetical protein